MAPSPSPPDPADPLPTVHRVDLKCDEFESAWNSGERPTIEEYLEGISGTERQQLLRELVALEIELRERGGETPKLNEYTPRFAEMAADLETLFSDKKNSSEEDTLFIDSEKTVDPTLKYQQRSQFDSGMVGRESANIDSVNQTRQWIEEQEHLQHFGDYVIIAEIARGGMGIVYKAYQRNLNRLVALKMISQGEFANQEEIKRFQLEAEAAAQLDHPGIVPVYDVGEHEGRHYFSMGLVEGGSLSQAVVSQSLTPKEVAQLVLKICEAMAYAHSKRVIHRDLKPGNVLLDQNKEPRITDFGLAKRIEEGSNLTMTGQVLGTPSYMPPEQAGGLTSEITETADIYSIGAILYALLCGRPPFQSPNPMTTLRQVLEEEPITPRQFNSKIPVDLETICLKSLEKKREQRYQSAEELAEELKRFIDGHPILARPISSFARLKRWCERNRTVSGLIVAVMLTMVLGSGFSIYFGLLAQGRAESAIRNQQIATEQTQLALDALTTIIFEINTTLSEIPDVGEKRKEIVAEAVNKLEQVSDGLENSTQVSSARAAALINLADIYSRLGDETGKNSRTRSFELFKKSITQFEQIVDVEGNRDTDTLWKYSVALQRVASASIESNKIQEAEPYLLKCVELRMEVAKAEPDNVKYATGVVHAHLEEGEFWNQQYKSPKALEAHSKALEIAEKLLEKHPDNFEIIYVTIYARTSVGSMYDLLNKAELSKQHHSSAFELFEKANARYPNNRMLLKTIAWNREILAQLYAYRLKDADAAETTFQEGIQFLKQAIENDPRDLELQAELALTYDALIGFYLDANRTKNLIEAMHKRIEIRRGLVANDPSHPQLFQELMKNYRELGTYHLRNKEYQPAIELFLSGKIFLDSLGDRLPEQARNQIKNLEVQIENCRDKISREQTESSPN
ncbi:MAG: protein kinase [Planctomycetaceae bacterium]|nr:protein kinase [Planctomycetaceae bacterium]